MKPCACVCVYVRAWLCVKAAVRVRACVRALAAGAMWRCRTASAPWAGRSGHTSVVDAAGAIYVIGGVNRNTLTVFRDVWASTDGGARAGLAPGVVGGTQGGATGVLQGT